MGADNEGKELGYFMGRVDNQLGQIIERLEDMKSSISEIAREQTSQGNRLGTVEERLESVEKWKDEMKDPSDFIRWSTLREKITAPVLVSVLIFILTVVVPGLIALFKGVTP